MGKRSFGSDADRRNMAEISGADQFPESAVVDLDGEDPNAYEIDIVDDTPEEDRGRPNAKHFTADEDEDLSGYADKTRKRIERLKFETHSERREREAAERQRDEAVAYAKQRDAEIADLRKRLDSGGAALASSMVAEREAKLADAKRRLSSAYADGDSEAIAAATADMSTASAELASIKARIPAPRPEGEKPAERQPAQPAQPAAPAAPDIAPQVLDWISYNREWFNKDGEKTRTAVRISREVEESGIRPTDPDYTREVDKRLKRLYPEHKPFNTDGEPSDEERRGPRRSYGGEQTGRVQEDRERSNPRRITLTNSELAIAKRLGVTPQAYAAEKAKREARTNGAGA